MKQPVLLMLLLSASISSATDFKEDDWNLTNDSVTRIESAKATCTTNLDRLAKYGIRGSEKTTFSVVRPNYMNSQVLVNTQFFSMNLDKGQTPSLSRKSLSNNGMEKGFFGGESQYIKQDVVTELKLESNSEVGSVLNRTSTELSLRAMDDRSGVEISIPSGSRIVRRGESSLSISSDSASVSLIDVQSVGNWRGVGFQSTCQLTLNFKKFPAKKTKTKGMTRTSFSMSGSGTLLPVK
jgi:hypothetical protein